MRTARFLVPEEWIAKKSGCFSIPPGPLHAQMIKVLRLKPDDLISLLPNDGTELTCKITDINRQHVTGTIVEKKEGAPLTPELTLCAAMTKRDTFEWTLQKATELGVTRIIPLITARVIKKATAIPPRWNLILKEATEQSGRTVMPKLLPPTTLKEALSDRRADVKIFGDEEGGDHKLPVIHRSAAISLFVGPEGGFTDEERELLLSEDAHRITLGNLVLRAETAAVAGLTLLRFR